MAIRILRIPEPLSSGSAAADRPMIPSSAGRILRQELHRYCRGEIHGRSFLLSGHRGSGKTTTILDVIHDAVQACEAGTLPLRPVPVLLHGPSLLTIPRAEPAGAATADGTVPPLEADRRELQTQSALQQILLGLHRAVVKEFVTAYRRCVVEPGIVGGPTPGADGGELAAQFEIELIEDPPASRLREFWSEAGVVERGVLFPLGRPLNGSYVAAAAQSPLVPDQGARELVALNGICSAHQRLSGALSRRMDHHDTAGTERQSTSGFDPKVGDAVKAASALIAGASVAGGALARGGNTVVESGVLGLLTAIAASYVFKRMTTTSSKRERRVDTSFIPDLSARTLDRVLPTYLNRLKDAGLAPVFVIDELDKVEDNLKGRLTEVAGDLKKLVAESAFTCFLTDRDYLEQLYLGQRTYDYGITSSSFSHPFLIVHEPGELDDYLNKILVLTSDEDELDKKILKRVLRHRAQMHALRLTRELVALRQDNGEMSLPPQALRKEPIYRIDFTFQVAIEFYLSTPRVQRWSAQRPQMRQTLFDALYFISRCWLAGDVEIDLGETGRSRFVGDLDRRIGCAETPVADPLVKKPSFVTDDDLKFLFDLTAELAEFLATKTREAISREWPNDRIERIGEPALPVPDGEEIQALYVVGESLLERKNGAGPRTFTFRYTTAGDVQRKTDAQLTTARAIHDAAGPTLAYVTTVDRALAQLFQLPSADLGSGFRLLCDTAHVLPQTPAWQGAVTMHAALTQARFGAGSPARLRDDLEQIKAFAHEIRDAVDGVGLAYIDAAFLSGMVGQPDDAALVDGLQILADGFEFQQLGSRDVQAALREFQRQLEELVGTKFPAAPTFDASTGTLLGDHAAARAKAALIGTDALRKIDWSTQIDAAWAAIRGRLRALAAGNGSGIASIAELLCAAGRRGPNRYVRLSPAKTALAEWTALFVEAAQLQPDRVAEAVPPDMAGIALYMAGYVQADRVLLETLARHGRSVDPNVPERVGLQVPARHDGTLPAGTVVLIRRHGDSISRLWTERPTRALVLVFNRTDWLSALGPNHLFKDLSDYSIIVAWETDPAGNDREDSLYARSLDMKSLDFRPFDERQAPWSSNDVLRSARGADEFCALINLPHTSSR